MKTIKQIVGQRIKLLRKKSGLSQEELGFKIDLTRASIINLEAGRCSTTLETFLHICFILKVTPNDILPLDYKFNSPDGETFKAAKLDAKSEKLKAKLAEVERQRREILKLKKSPKQATS
jgi:transcriptional regulator with XRE-family HTH domain